MVEGWALEYRARSINAKYDKKQNTKTPIKSIRCQRYDFARPPLPCLRWLVWSFDVLYEYYVIFASHVYEEGDSNLPCQAGFKLPSYPPPPKHSSAEEVQKYLYRSLFMAYVWTIIVLLLRFAAFLKEKQYLVFIAILYNCWINDGGWLLFNLYTLGSQRMQPIQTPKLSLSGTVCVCIN